MAVNQATVATLQSSPVPPDLQCIAPQELVDALATLLRVVGLASQVQGAAGVTPVTNNLGQQALTLAQANQQSIVQLQQKTIQRRVLARSQNVVDGDSVQNYGIAPPMPTTDYIIVLNIEGSTTAAGSFYGWRVVSGTKTTTSVSIVYDNFPAGSVVTIVAEEARSIE